MSEFERPSYVSNSGEQDPNIVESLIAAAESKIQALERKIQTVPSAAVVSVEAQIKAEMKRIEELRSKLNEQKSSN